MRGAVGHGIAVDQHTYGSVSPPAARPRTRMRATAQRASPHVLHLGADARVQGTTGPHE